MMLKIEGVEIEWAESKGRKLRLTISPKTAIPCIHVPKNYSQTKALDFVKENIAWIKKHQARIEEKIFKKNIKASLKDGSTVSLWGADYKIKILRAKKHASAAVDDDFIYLKEPPGADTKKRPSILNRLYKKELELYVEEILPFWEAKIKESASEIKYRDMKSKWGSCNSYTGIITLNTKLAALPCECAEMVLVHEFVHFKERLHNDRFKRYMTKYLPDWKERVKLLNSEDY